MEFSGQYLTYVEYVALGGTLSQMPFNLLEFNARKQIDINTKNRLKGIDEIPQEVKLCVFYLINAIDNFMKATDRGNIASENIDGYSVSYTDSSIQQIIKSKNNQVEDIIMTNLYGVIVNNEHLIYRG
jgi:hypothetical protein